jgi:hypothetical protein
LGVYALGDFVLCIAFYIFGSSGENKGKTMNNKKSTKETIHWFIELNAVQRQEVHTWLKLNNPPEDWQGSALDYAYTEMILGDKRDSWNDSAQKSMKKQYGIYI